jgi:hypothetical protein
LDWSSFVKGWGELPFACVLRMSLDAVASAQSNF